jgi:hypothetical protein
MLPEAERLIMIMREVRDSSSYDLNPHVPGEGCTLGICRCARSRRVTAAWGAFHDALSAAGVPPLVEVERAARGDS